MTHHITVTPEADHELCTCSCGATSGPCTGRWAVAEWSLPHLGYKADPDRWLLQLLIAEVEYLVTFPPRVPPRVLGPCVDRCPCGGQIVSGGEDEDRCTRCGPVGSRWAPVG